MCDVCTGSGELPIYNNTAKYVMTIACPRCGGSGGDPITGVPPSAATDGDQPSLELPRPLRSYWPVPRGLT